MGEFRGSPDLVDRIRRIEERLAAVAAPLKPTYARASGGPSTTLTTGVETALTLASNNAHTWNMDVTGTKITVTLQGVYVITSNVGFLSSATGYRSIRVRRTRVSDGAQVNVCGDARPAVSGAITRCSAAGVFYMAAGDYLEVLALQTSGGNLDLEDDGAGTSDGFRALNVFFVAP